jgi:uncharacterized protein involved in exopolysaccharide biosynthesis
MSLQNALPQSVADTKRLVKRHYWRMILAALLVPLLVLTAALFVPRQYEAEAVFERRNDLVMNEVVGRGAPQSFGRIKQGLSSDLAGVLAIQKAVEDLKLIPPLPAGATPEDRQRREISKQDLVSSLQRSIRVIYELNMPEVDRVRLVLNDTDAARARLVVNKLIENYIVSARQQVDSMLTQSASFFERQANTSRDEIETLEQRKLTFEIEKRDLLPAENGTFNRSLPELEDRESLAQQALDAAKQKVETLTGELAKIKADVTEEVRTPNPELPALQARLADANRRLDQALSVQRMTDKHPTVIATRKQIAELQQQIDKTPREIVSTRTVGESPRRTSVELALIEARTQLDKSTTELAAAKRQVDRTRKLNGEFFPVRSEYRKIERSLDEAQRRLKFWEDNLQRVRVALTAELGDRGIALNFLRPCEPIQRPSSPSFTQILFIAALLAVAAAFLWVVLAEQSDNRFDTSRPNEQPLTLPVIGTVSKIVPQPGRWKKRLLMALGFQAGGASMLLLLASVTYVNYKSLHTPRNIQAELIASDPTPLDRTSDASHHAAVVDIPGGN